MRNYAKILKIFAKERQNFSRVGFSMRPNSKLTYQNLVTASFGRVSIKLDNKLIQASHDFIATLIKQRKAIYGVTTSFGGNIKNIIPPEKSKILQQNLIVSHATNVGDYFPYEICKAAFLGRLFTFSKGYSGVNPRIVALMRKFLEAGVIPAMKIHGSMGASGDLNPLAMMALPLIGQGMIWSKERNRVIPTQKMPQRYKLSPVSLNNRDGLALINGTAVMTAVGSFYLWYLKRLIENSLLISALSVEALQASNEPFNPALHNLKPHKYQIRIAKIMASLLKTSKFAQNYNALKNSIELKLQENHDVFKSDVDLHGGSYSLRAIPQVYQPIMAIFDLFRVAIDTELNSIDDNPVVFSNEKKVAHGANFHGHPISVIADALNGALISISNISLARIDRMLKTQHSGLPMFLATGQEGLFLGMQGVQYTAVGIGAELRSMAYPLSVNQIMSNNDNQDIVSFGLQATLKGLEMTTLLSYILAIEALNAVQAVWIRMKNIGAGALPDKYLSPLTLYLYSKISQLYSPKADDDQISDECIERVSELLITCDMLPDTMSRILWEDDGSKK